MLDLTRARVGRRAAGVNARTTASRPLKRASHTAPFTGRDSVARRLIAGWGGA